MTGAVRGAARPTNHFKISFFPCKRGRRKEGGIVGHTATTCSSVLISRASVWNISLASAGESWRL